MYSSGGQDLDEPSQLTALRQQQQHSSPRHSRSRSRQALLAKRRQTLPLYNDKGERVHKYKDRFSFLRNSKFLQDLENDSVDSEIIEEELSALQEVPISTREKVAKFLQSNPVQILLCVIVLLDAGIVIAQILLDLNSVREKLYRRDFQLSSLLRYIKETEADRLHGYPGEDIDLILRMLQNTSAKVTANRTGSVSMTSSGHDPQFGSVKVNRTKGSPTGHEEISDARSGSGSVPVDDFHFVESGENDILHEVAHGLHFASIALLGFLVVEDLIKIVAMGRTFFKHKIEIFDAVIIVSSFAIDIVFLGGVSGEEGKKAAAVLVILLLWRIARVVDGIVITVKQRQEFRIRLQKRARRIAEKKLESFEEERHAKTRQIEALKDLCTKAGINDADIDACSPIDPKRVNTTLCALSSVARLSVSMTMLMSSGVYRPRILDEKFVLPKLINPRSREQQQQQPQHPAAAQQRRGILPRIESLPIMKNSYTISGAKKKQQQQQRRNRKSMPGRMRGGKSGNGEVAIDSGNFRSSDDCSRVTIESTASSCASVPEVEPLDDDGGDGGDGDGRGGPTNAVVESLLMMESPVNSSGIEIVISRISDEESESNNSGSRHAPVASSSSSSSSSSSATTTVDHLPGQNKRPGCDITEQGGKDRDSVDRGYRIDEGLDSKDAPPNSSAPPPPPPSGDLPGGPSSSRTSTSALISDDESADLPLCIPSCLPDNNDQATKPQQTIRTSLWNQGL